MVQKQIRIINEDLNPDAQKKEAQIDHVSADKTLNQRPSMMCSVVLFMHSQRALLRYTESLKGTKQHNTTNTIK